MNPMIETKVFENMDMISQLPEHIIHDILSCLPNKDSARTCVLSKTWRHVQATKPVMVFNHFEFDPQLCGMRSEFLFPRISQKKDLFMDYVVSSLEYFFHHQQKLRNFDLTFCTYDPKYEQDFGRVDQWLQGVVHNGFACLSLHMISCTRYPLPHDVLSSQMLHELCLSGSLLLDACIDINLPALKVLSLCNIHSCNDDLVKHLFFGCPSVEVLRIKDCNNLVDLQVSSLSRLVELSLNSCNSIKIVEIGSPNFHYFSYSRGSSQFPRNITLLGVSKTLRKLKMDICCNIGHHNLFHQLSTFIQLEELFLEHVDLGKFPNMKISSQSLKRLIIRSLLNMTEVVEIECPNLHALEYTSNVFPFYSLSPLNPKHIRVEFQFHALHHVSWLDALKILFENGFSTTKYPKVFIVLKDHKEVIILDLDSGLIEVMLSFFCQVEDLDSASRIIVASDFGNLRNELLTPMPPHLAFNIVSSFTSNFTQLLSEKLSRILESCACIVEKDTTTVNIPIMLRQCLSSSYQITRIVSKWDWTI